MALTTSSLPLSFYLDGRKLANPNPSSSIEDVRVHYAGVYPELNNSSYTEEFTDKEHKVTFTTSVGSKG